MKHLNTLLLLLLLGTTVAFATQKRKVLFIGLDGTRSDALQQANTPNIDSLIAHGSYSFNSYCLGITVSGPSWSSIFTGVWYPKHGVTDNSYSGQHFDQYKMYPALAKQRRPNLFASEVMEWNPLIDQVPNAFDGYDVRIKTGNDCVTTSTTPLVVTQIANSNLDIMTCYFDSDDCTGHSSGFTGTNPAYIASIEGIDAAIGSIMTALKNRPNYANEDWLILLTTDHGGIGTGHGGNTWQERHIWWIGSGTYIRHKKLNVDSLDPGTYRIVPPGVDTVKLKKVPVQTDIAVTALHFLLYDDTVAQYKYPQLRTTWNLDGHSWLDTIYNPPVVTPTGVANTTKEEEFDLTMFPNPTNNMVTFWVEAANNEAVSYAVVNSTGITIKQEENVKLNGLKLNIDLAAQPDGLYYIQVRVGEKAVTKKVMVKH